MSNVCACIRASCASPFLTATQLRQHSAPSTPSHVRVCVREMECVYVTAMNKGGRRWSPEKPEEEKRRGEIDMEGSDLREGRVRHLEKRKSHWDEEEITAAQQ